MILLFVALNVAVVALHILQYTIQVEPDSHFDFKTLSIFILYFILLFSFYNPPLLAFNQLILHYALETIIAIGSKVESNVHQIPMSSSLEACDQLVLLLDAFEVGE